MKLEDFLAANNGGWSGSTAFAFIDDHRWKVAYIEDGVTKLTPDGARLGVELLANTSADVVISEEPKKRGRKAKVDETPAADELDDLDI